MSERERLVRHAVQEWLDKAEDDLAQAAHDLSTSFDRYWVIAYHAQQAAEKYIKALLIRHQVDFPDIHSIEKLRRLVRAADPDLADSFAPADILSAYAVEPRYPATLPVEDGRDRIQA